METLGDKLRNLRENLGLMQKFVANEIGINSKVLSHYENNIRYPDLNTFMLLCKFYNISSDKLLGIDNSTSSSENSLSTDEHDILEYYRELNKRNKDIARGYLANLCKEQQINQSINSTKKGAV